MNAVEGFVHLYHVWGALGALTAFLFGREAYSGWRGAGGTWKSAPGEWAYALRWFSLETAKDLGRMGLWAVKSFFGVPFDWGQSEWKGRSYPRRQIILLGITMGGTSRMLTALYWAERNRDWMAHVDLGVIVAASAFILPAVIGDLFHQLTAWPKQKHRARLLTAAALAWIAAGLIA